MKIRDLRQSVVIIVLLAVAWTVPVAVGKIASPQTTRQVQGGKITLEAGESQVEIAAPAGFSEVISPQKARASLVKGDARISFHLATGAENQEKSLERALLVLSRKQGPAQWRGEEVRVSQAIEDSGSKHDLVGRGCEIEQTVPRKCVIVGAGKLVLTIVSSGSEIDPVDVVQSVRGGSGVDNGVQQK
ncbi:hypothetical protein [Corynebacterium ulcerans]|uniref:hypothetical protein n=1 Tax=Corynebacterium ulcerans TaxID=65058 RepID=UPI0005FEB179|nr:hypothetical protein [Corynebacterium ulcerans]AKA97457.1 Hypothetical protein CUL131002_1955c [Corynebacterium ulcerans]